MGDAANPSYDDVFSEDFQVRLLATISRVPGYLQSYRTALRPEFFSTDPLRQVAEVVADHVDTYKTLPSLELIDNSLSNLPDDSEAARRLLPRMFSMELQDAAAIRDKAVEFGQLQALVACTLRMADKIHAKDVNKAEMERELRDALLVGTDLNSTGIRYHRDLPELLLNLTRPKEEQHHELIPTGIPHLDYMLGGGLRRGELGMVIAPPKRFKTTTLVNIGFGALRSALGFNVVHYSLEIQGDRVAERYIRRLAGPARRLRHKPEAYCQAITARSGRFIRGELVIRDYPTRTATPSSIRSHLSLLVAQGFRPDLVIVDYGDLVKPERRIGEMRHEVAGIYEDLRTIAGEFQCVVWTASQTNRFGLEKPTVDIGDVGESFEKTAIVDAVLTVSQTRDEKVDGRLRLFGAALRNEESGCTVECAVDPRRCYLSSIALYSPANELIPVDAPKAEVDDTPYVPPTPVGPPQPKEAGQRGPQRKSATGPTRKVLPKPLGPQRKAPAK